MNQQRIMEIWNQANSRYYQSESDQPLPQFIFAELIVKECIQAVDNVGGFNEEFHMNAIKEHFGVEE